LERGRLALGAVEPKFWERFCRAVGREDLIPWQLDPAAREEVEISGRGGLQRP
jgi:ferritin